MANPRKFSEKIALHNQKQAEETAAFEQIMREVIGATRGPTYPKNQHLHISSSVTVGGYRAVSLPNVNQIGGNSDKAGIDLQTALNNLEDMKQGRDSRERRNVRSNSSGSRSAKLVNSSHHNDTDNDRQLQFDMSQKSLQNKPYPVTYLTPPPDTSWRRTNSDSALHQSAMMCNQFLDGFHAINSTFRRSTVHDVDSSMVVDDSNPIDSWDPGKGEKFFLGAPMSDDSRPKSCEVPGITIFPTQEDLNTMHHHIPISSNTGSLPDLTNLHFPAPLATPIDIDDQNAIQNPNSPYHSGPDSPYSPNSPHSNTNLSPPPNALQHINNNMIYHSHAGNSNGGNEIKNTVSNQRQMSSSPGPSPSPTSSRRRHHHNLNNLVIGGNPRHQHHSVPPHSPHNQQQQVCYTHSSTSPPRITVEGLTIDTSALTLNGNSQYVASSGGQSLGFASSPQYHSLQQSQNYVPPQSPLQQQMAMGLHRSTTPSDHSCSAPTSPVSHNISPINSPGLPSNNLNKSPFTDNSYFNVQQTSVLQHQLEQFRMDLRNDATDQYLMMPGNGTTGHSSSSSASSSTGGLYMGGNNTVVPTSRASLSDSTANIDYSPQQSPQTLVNSSSNCLDSHQSDSIYYTSNQCSSTSLIHSPTLAYSKSVISSPSAYQQTTGSNQPQTPQTPTSIPDIILTGPNIDDSLLRGQDFAKDIGTAMASMSGSFDTADLFPSADEALRAGLDPIDFDGLQILPDIDATSDEAFSRLERS